MGLEVQNWLFQLFLNRHQFAGEFLRFGDLFGAHILFKMVAACFADFSLFILWALAMFAQNFLDCFDCQWIFFITVHVGN